MYALNVQSPEICSLLCKDLIILAKIKDVRIGKIGALIGNVWLIAHRLEMKCDHSAGQLEGVNTPSVCGGENARSSRCKHNLSVTKPAFVSRRGGKRVRGFLLRMCQTTSGPDADVNLRIPSLAAL